LDARAAGDAPVALVVDVEQSGAIEAVERVRQMARDLVVFCVGDPIRAADLGATIADRRCFERPVDIDALLLAISEVAGSAPRVEPMRGTTPPPSYPPRRQTAPPVRRPSDEPRSEFPL